MAIDLTYFIREISVPNLNNPTVSEEFNDYIGYFQKEILIDLLGYDLYKAYKEGIASQTPEQKWIDLRDGKEFSFNLNGKTINTKWNGFENEDKESFISYYIYCFWVRKTMQILTNVGVTSSNVENSTAVNAERKIVTAWNKFLNLYGDVPSSFDRYNPYVHYDENPSAYNFLLAKYVNYDNWVFKRREKIVIGGF